MYSTFFFILHNTPNRIPEILFFRTKYLLTFFDQSLIERVFSSESNIIKGKHGKDFIYKRVFDFFNINFKGKTDPFYVKSPKNYDVTLESIKLIMKG